MFPSVVLNVSQKQAVGSRRIIDKHAKRMAHVAEPKRLRNEESFVKEIRGTISTKDRIAIRNVLVEEVPESQKHVWWHWKRRDQSTRLVWYDHLHERVPLRV